MRLQHSSIRRASVVLTVVAASVLAGCTAAGPDGALSVSTDREHYQRSAPEQVAAVTFTAKNVADKTLYLGRCGSAVATYVDRLEAGEWVEYARLGIVCQAAYDMSPILLAPAESVSPPAVRLGPGVYRLRVPFGFSSAAYDRTAVSNPFAVE